MKWGFSADDVLAIVAVLGMIGTLIAFVGSLVLKSIFGRQDDKITTAAEGLKESIEERKALEKRISDIERNYVSRAEDEKGRLELLAAIDKMGDRFEKSMEEMGKHIDDRFDTIIKRVERVEANAV